MSSRKLTHIETYLLPKRLDFSITSKTLPNKDITTTMEDAVKDLEKEDTIRAKISLTLQNSKPPMDKLSKDEHKALKELNADTSVLILPAGKGRSPVILNREDYLQKRIIHWYTFVSHIYHTKGIIQTGSYKQWSISVT